MLGERFRISWPSPLHIFKLDSRMSLIREYARPDTFCYICKRDLFDREQFSPKVFAVYEIYSDFEDFKPLAYICPVCMDKIQDRIIKKILDSNASCKNCDALINYYDAGLVNKDKIPLPEFYKGIYEGKIALDIEWDTCSTCKRKDLWDKILIPLRESEDSIYKQLVEKTKEFKEQHDSEQNTNVMRFKR